MHSATSESISGGEFTASSHYRYRYFTVHLNNIVVTAVPVFIVMDTPQSEPSVSAFSFMSSPSPAIVPDQLTHGGTVWKCVERPENKRKGSKVSKIWEYGHRYISVDNIERVCWRCRLCSPENTLIALTVESVSNCLKHLRRKHNIDAIEGPIVDRSESRLLQSFNATRFRRHLLQWLVKRQHSFIEVEDEDFQEMLCACNEAVEPYLPRSGSTIKNWVVDEFEKVKNEVQVQLMHAQSKVHISFDLWSSPSGYSLCGIVAHFIGLQNTVQHCLIGMKCIGCSYSGENITAEVIPVLKEFEL